MLRTKDKLLKHKVSRLGFVAFAMAVAMVLAIGTALAQTSPSASALQQLPEAPKGTAFASPHEAASALYGAARRNDESALLAILGPDAKEVLMWSDDPQVRQAHREHFANKYDQMHRLVTEPDKTVALYVGSENWPFPIPIVQSNGSWYFDTELGRQEILYRRIGRNEFEALRVCDALIDAEKDFYKVASRYTSKFVSSENAHDGLYWKGAEATQNSPIGPHLAFAGVSDGSSKETGTPYHGYYYRIVLPTSSSFAVIAFPAAYRMSGVMTFIVLSNNTAYEKDLGQDTSNSAKQIASDTPDNTWKKIE